MANDPATIAITRETADDLDLVIEMSWHYASDWVADADLRRKIFEACARLQPEVYRLLSELEIIQGGTS